MAHWLAKTEPAECSIDDFATHPDKPLVWEGVRNYQARNFMRQMRLGDEVFIYHSSCKHIGIAGIACVAREAYPDPAQFNQKSPYFDARSSHDKPHWDAVDMLYVEKFSRLLPLEELKAIAELGALPLVKQGNRLSVMPVGEGEWGVIMKLAASR
jgi:predicted RNA-binding protein with PUA-like domain